MILSASIRPPHPNKNTLRVFVGYECSGVVRAAFERRGHNVFSCDLKPSEDNSPRHIVGDIFEALEILAAGGWVPDLAVFHPPCTYHANSAAWAFNDPDFVRYPDKGGYHQKVKPGTLVGLARRLQRESDERDLEKLKRLPFFKAIENPRNTWDKRTTLGKPHDSTQPYEFGHDASKETTFRFFDEHGNPVPLKLTRHKSRYVQPRLVPREKAMGKSDKANKNKGPAFLPRWGNQTDTGQNAMGPREGRDTERSRTYEGIAVALAECLLRYKHTSTDRGPMMPDAI